MGQAIPRRIFTGREIGGDHMKKECILCGILMDEKHEGDICECCLDDIEEGVLDEEVEE